jgi:hypothetical protein
MDDTRRVRSQLTNRDTSFRTYFPTTAEIENHGEIHLIVRNIAVSSAMCASRAMLSQGDRLMLRLPRAGRIEALVAWIVDQRIGLRFERPIKLHEFNKMIVAMKATL